MEFSTAKFLLIIFYRNPLLGKVKTRLARTLGDSAALNIYHQLVAHTKSITEQVLVDKAVYYSAYIDLQDIWNNDHYQKRLQAGHDLGQRMSNAFKHGFESGYSSICIIGTDCFELEAASIDEAFLALQYSDAVIGPARDGGYYLLGMNAFHPELFANKTWSTSAVYASTIQDFADQGLRYHNLPLLSDVDIEDDLPDSLKNFRNS